MITISVKSETEMCALLSNREAQFKRIKFLKILPELLNIPLDGVILFLSCFCGE